MAKTIILFDVDGTLTLPRKQMESPIASMLDALHAREDVDVGIVGGSDITKQEEQLGKAALKRFKYVFSQNGLVAYRQNLKPFHNTSFTALLGEVHMKALINICLKALANTDPPKKRGTFIEHRTGMLNISPIGRSCSQEEREEFYQYDERHQVRAKVIDEIKENWKNYKPAGAQLPALQFSIGGEISIDIFPENWDKTYCLQFLKQEYSRIIFIGDKTSPGGNDYEIFESPITEAYTTTGPSKTIEIVGSI